MTAAEHDAAIARLEVKVEHLTQTTRKQDENIEKILEKLTEVTKKLDQAEGGIALLRILGFGSLGGAIVATIAFFKWLND